MREPGWLSASLAVVAVLGLVGCEATQQAGSPSESSTTDVSSSAPITPTNAPSSPSMGTPLPGAPVEFVATSGRRLAVFESTGKLKRYLTNPTRHQWDGVVSVTGSGGNEQVVFLRGNQVMQVRADGRGRPTVVVPAKHELSSVAISASGRTLAYSWQPSDEEPDEVDVVSVATGELLGRYYAPPVVDMGSPLGLQVVDVNNRQVVVLAGSHNTVWAVRANVRKDPVLPVARLVPYQTPRGCSDFPNLWFRSPNIGGLDGVARCKDGSHHVTAGPHSNKIDVREPLPEGPQSWSWSADDTGQFLIGASRRFVVQVHARHLASLPCSGSESLFPDGCPVAPWWL